MTKIGQGGTARPKFGTNWQSPRREFKRQFMRDYTPTNALKWSGRQWRLVRKTLQRGELN